MHYEILVEDISGKALLDILVPKIIGENNSVRVISYKGIGKIPKGLKSKTDASKRILLDQLPKLIRGYGKTLNACRSSYKAKLIIVCDLDNRDCEEFLRELNELLSQCTPRPRTEFCLAIEEIEAWLLGDISAILRAYPNSNGNILERYVNDSICNTWELLADAIYEGGHEELKKQGWHFVGKMKSCWANKIGKYIDIENNNSPSFQHMVKTLNEN